MIIRKTAAELQKMRRSGLLVWQILQEMEKMAGEGVSTLDLEVAAERMMKDAGARPAFKGYYVPAAGDTFRFVLCTSVNDEIVHGMPSAKRVLKKGDIVSIDTGVQLDGYYGDSATTVAIGEVGEQTRKLMRLPALACWIANSSDSWVTRISLRVCSPTSPIATVVAESP